MIVRIRFGRRASVGKKPKRSRFAFGMAGLLTPAAVLAAVIGAWGIAADLKWSGSFAISEGFFSHWEVWVAAAAALQLCAYLLNRYAKGGETAAT